VEAYTDVAQELSDDPAKIQVALFYSILAIDSAVNEAQTRRPRALLSALVREHGEAVRIAPISPSRYFLRMAPDGGAVAVYTAEGATVWALPSTKTLLRIDGLVNDVQFSGDSTKAAVSVSTSHVAQTVMVFDLTTGKPLTQWEGECTPFAYASASCAVLSRDLAWIAVRNGDLMRVVNAASGAEAFKFAIPGDVAEVTWARAGLALYATRKTDEFTELVYARPLQRECVRWSNVRPASDACFNRFGALGRDSQALLANDGETLLLTNPSRVKQRRPHTPVLWYSMKIRDFHGFTDLETETPVRLIISPSGQVAAVVSAETGRVWLNSLGSKKWPEGQRTLKTLYPPDWLPALGNSLVGLTCGSDDCETSGMLFSWDTEQSMSFGSQVAFPLSIRAISEDLTSAVRDDGLFLTWERIGEPQSQQQQQADLGPEQAFARACASIAYKLEAFKLPGRARSRCMERTPAGGFADEDFVALNSHIQLGEDPASHKHVSPDRR
jgi:hypothetical protein